MAKLKLVKAEEKHFQGVLDISKGVYEGLDYLPGVYHVWLEQEAGYSDWRKNVVLLDEQDRVIGFQSFLLQDKSRRVIAQALRIDKSVQGRGLGREFMKMCRDFLLDLNSEVINK